MNKMNVAIPTNDEQNIAERTGRAKGFLIYEIDGQNYKRIDFRENPHKHHDHDDHDHGTHSHEDVMQVLSDCDYIIINKVGKHFKQDLDSANINFFKTKVSNIENALDEFIKNQY